MKKRTANKILKAVFDYKEFRRWDMPYNGKQIWQAAKTLLPPELRQRYKGWHRETEVEGWNSFLERINKTKL